MFNVCVDAVVRELLHQMLDEDAARDRTSNGVAEILVTIYVNNRLLASWDPVWLQELFHILIGLFERIGLFASAAKTKVVVCIPGQRRGAYTENQYAE
jgi:hypothetical protein